MIQSLKAFRAIGNLISPCSSCERMEYLGYFGARYLVRHLATKSSPNHRDRGKCGNRCKSAILCAAILDNDIRAYSAIYLPTTPEMCKLSPDYPPKLHSSSRLPQNCKLSRDYPKIAGEQTHRLQDLKPKS